MALKRTIEAKPFLKWAGGKTQLLPVLDAHLPAHFSEIPEVTYIEPFVGGGAMLFHMLRTYPNIQSAIINDLNGKLINAYRIIRNSPQELIECLTDIQMRFYELADNMQRKDFFLSYRERFNREKLTKSENAAILIFLNRTCFNGLYRENSKGEFNVPFGRYVNPTICDKETILANSRLLQKVTILNGDFSMATGNNNGYTFIYFDPPYRPLSNTSNFNSYVKEPFNDNEQIRLRDHVVELTQKDVHILLSNSDGRASNPQDLFFDHIYNQFHINRIEARRNINANALGRGVTSELLIRNYERCKGVNHIMPVQQQLFYANV